MKRIAFFDQRGFDSAKKTVEHNADILNKHLKEFNKLVDPSLAIIDIESLYSSISNPSDYVKTWLLKDEDFRIGGKPLSVEKIFELNLVQLPSWHAKAVNLESYQKLIRFRQQDYIFEKGSVKINPNLDQELKEMFSYHLLPEKEEEFDILNKLIERALKAYPNRSLENKFATLTLYLEEHIRVEAVNEEFILIPNPSLFSGKIRPL